jgi:APA family basic amino acid/polyamine antiporter
MHSSEIAFAPSRNRSGLVQSFGVFGAFLFGVHCISLSSSGFIPFSWVASVWPGASIKWVLLIAAVFCAIHGAAYAVIGGTVSLAGADFRFSSKVLPPALCFAASWTLVLFSGIVAGGLAAWIPQSALPALLRPMAIILNDVRFQDLADFSSSFWGSMIIGGGVVIVAASSICIRNASIQRILSFGLVLGLAAWAVIYYSLWSASGPSTFAHAWDRFMGPTGAYGAFSQRLPLAQKAGMTINHSTGQVYLAGLIMGFWIYYGYYIPTFFSEEVRRPAKTLVIASLSSIAVSGAIFVLAAVLLQRIVKLDWLAAEGYLFNNPDAVKAATGGQKVIAMPWITFYAAILRPQPFLIWVVAIGWLFTLVNLIQTYLYYTSRILFSWSIVRLAPEWLTRVGKRTGTPSNAIIVIACFTSIGLFDAARGGPLGTQLTFAFFAVATQLVAITALLCVKRVNPELYQRVPSLARKPLPYLRVSLLTILAVVTLVYLLWMLVASFLYPAAGVAHPQATLTLLLVMMVSGFAWFYITRWYRQRREKIDIMDSFRQSLPANDSEPSFD